jgi:hypothetical protein
MAPEKVDLASRERGLHVGVKRSGELDLLREALVLHRLAHEPLVRAPPLQQLVPGLVLADDGHTFDPTSRDFCR